ncbi:MAG: Crp/Fnr family transcriptional regulator [Cytophagales bacterium]|nr:Crp/Fnr family transcriptional regulator [Cytophagales bacterium]
MSKQLLAHINKYIKVSDDEFETMQGFFTLKNYGKKDIIARAGTRCNFNYFVLSGCLHMFFIDDKGTERTVQFAIENWWMTDHLAYFNRSKTGFSIQAVEQTQLLYIHYDQQEELLSQFPGLEKYFRIIYQVAYGSALMKMKYLYDLSKEEIYFHFVDHFPEFAQRVPQYLIASYLGLTPEYVSEIRGRKRS